MQATSENIEDIYELSPMQEGMLYHGVQAPGAGLYVEQLLCGVRGWIDAAMFRRAWQLVVDRHPVLRTAFVWEGLDRPMQVVRRSAALVVEEQDWRGLGAVEQAARTDELLRVDRERGFLLDRAPLMRVTLVRTGDDLAQFLWTHHHLLLDGWSVPILLQEAAAAYEAVVRDVAPGFARRRPYRDYILWLRSRDLSAAESAWRAALGQAGPPTPLPLARPAAADERSVQTLTAQLLMTESETRAVEATARAHGLTLNTIVLGAWAMLLGTYASADTVRFGTSVSGRPPDLDGSDSMVGLFINSIPAQVSLDQVARVGAWLQGLQARQAELREFDSTPLVQIQKWIGAPGGTLFDSLVVFVNYPVEAAAASTAGSALSIESVSGFERTSMPLTVFAVPGRELGLKLMSDTGRYSEPVLASILGRLRTLIVNLAGDPDRRLGAVPIGDRKELHQILVEWDAPSASVPAIATHQLFESQTAGQPDGTAVVWGEARLTYRELNGRANQLARHLRRVGVGQGDAVALSVDRTFDMVVSALAILKAGATYVPIDPGFPAPRIAVMLEDTAARVLVTDSAHVDMLPAGSRQVLLLDREREAIDAEADGNLDISVDPGSDAYIIFTSGSTGVPKGAAIPHAALVNLLLCMRREPGLTPDDRMLAIATMSFDLAVLELFLPLACGAAIVLADRATASDGASLQRLLHSGGVTVMQGTPSTWRLLLASGWDGMPRVKMFTGGEPLPGGLATELLARGSSLWNLYGPTETTIYSTCRRVAVMSTDEHRDAIEPLGRPMANQPHYILDRALRTVPPGISGEVYIGGVCVARGYVNRPELTADRFLPDPFAGGPGARMYRSGDLARFRADGVMESLGRSDFQVKVRGYRVELGEIEAAIERLAGVRECLVLARPDEPGDHRLVAYIRTSPGSEIDVPAARTALRQRLPDYMLPASFVVLEEFPRLPNGKPDRKRLPAPGADRPVLQVDFEPPAGATEQRVARLWQEVLKIDRVGVNDNFFDVGGHSLLAVGLFGKLREEFGRELSLVDLFSYPTVRSMAAHLTEASPAHGVRAEVEATVEAGAGRARLASRRERRQE